MEICPDCHGAQRFEGIGCNMDDGCRAVSVPCFTCNGAGDVTPEVATRYRKGRALHDARVKMHYSLREIAGAFDVPAEDLMSMEQGRLEIPAEFMRELSIHHWAQEVMKAR